MLRIVKPNWDQTIIIPAGDQYTKWTFVAPHCYKWSDYSYPADGSSEKPHTWSYYKIDSGKWDKSKQKPYYPSKDGTGKFNNIPNTFDNHTFFVNFPDDKDAGFKDSDRSVHQDIILSFLDITPVISVWGRWKISHEIADRTTIMGKGVDRVYPGLRFYPSCRFALMGKYVFQRLHLQLQWRRYFEPEHDGWYPLPGKLRHSSHRRSGERPAKRQDSRTMMLRPMKRPTLLDINVKTFVIGFGQDIVGNQTLSNIAKAGGINKAYFAADFTQLKQALQDDLPDDFQSVLWPVQSCDHADKGPSLQGGL